VASAEREVRMTFRAGDGLRAEQGSVQSFSHIWFGLSGARHWLKR
jgi:hypothetical protein